MHRDFDHRLSEVVAARRFAEGVLGPHARLDDALVVVSELTSNAIRHAATGFTLSVLSDAEHVRIEVIDRGSGWPVVVNRSPEPTSGGMGLQLVEALADRWGAMERPGGKVVWAELDESR